MVVGSYDLLGSSRLLLCPTFCAALVSAQNAGIHLTVKPPRQPELWLGHGRVMPAQVPAARRYRAHRQKLNLQAARPGLPSDQQQ
jgi:hypothetical protein